ncbi:MAG: TolC family protein [Gammaproteobacteria bacterium]|nr:TolC family protein [Gammaproteobacteria bacterium]
MYLKKFCGGDRFYRLSLIGLPLFLLNGCATFSSDNGFNAVQTMATPYISQDLVWARSDADKKIINQRVTDLLEKPLDVDTSVQIALLNNRGLQAAYYELGISEADLVQAGRLTNPHLSLVQASATENGTREYTIEQALTFNIFSLVTMPRVVAIEKRRFEQAQRATALEVLRVAAETRKAYYRAVAAAQTQRYMQQVQQAADASAELARRMAQVGNFNKLEQAREHGFYADAVLNVARATQAALASREQLTRYLGLWGMQINYQLPERLPDFPITADDLPNIEQTAMAQRLDLQMLKIETAALAKNLGLNKTTRFINVLEAGPVRILEGQKDGPYKKGYEVSFELPLFDWGGAKVAKAEAVYMRQINLAAEAAINARSEVREAYFSYRSNFDIARHYRDDMVPTAKQISEENVLRYNGMLIGVFELLADARSQIMVVNEYIQAQRDFWLSQTDLQMSMIGKPNMSGFSASEMKSSVTTGSH